VGGLSVRWVRKSYCAMYPNSARNCSGV
jgi:hypothetical protein